MFRLRKLRRLRDKARENYKGRVQGHAYRKGTSRRKLLRVHRRLSTLKKAAAQSAIRRHQKRAPNRRAGTENVGRWLFCLPFSWKSAIFPLLSGLCCCGALLVLRRLHPLFALYKWAFALNVGTLMLALAILANILILWIMFREREAVILSTYTTPWHSWALSGVAVAVLYVVSVFGFAYLIYPFIPAAKAGGDYSSSDLPVYVTLNRSERECNSPELEKIFEPAIAGNPKLSRRSFVSLEEDSNWTYFAPVNGPNSGGGPTMWRLFAVCSMVQSNARCRPSVYEISRRCIAGTESANQ